MDNIIENNLLIAHFMGGLLNGEGRLNLNKNEIWLPLHGVCYHNTIDLGRGKTLEYHKSWDWLMPVAKKCDVIISENDLDEWVSNIYYALSTIEIGIIYNTVIDFINWYNSNIKGHETN
jgi:hypothetical protein